MWADIHFYMIHRFIHLGPLYRLVHYLHHKNVNFGPWSGLAMHPLEHLLFFSSVAVFWFIPSHSLHSIYLLQYLALGSSLAHTGFGQLVLNERATINIEDYMHYLHHKRIIVNFGVDIVPLDRWLGTFDGGSDRARSRAADN